MRIAPPPARSTAALTATARAEVTAPPTRPSEGTGLIKDGWAGMMNGRGSQSVARAAADEAHRLTVRPGVNLESALRSTEVKGSEVKGTTLSARELLAKKQDLLTEWQDLQASKKDRYGLLPADTLATFMTKVTASGRRSTPLRAS